MPWVWTRWGKGTHSAVGWEDSPGTGNLVSAWSMLTMSSQAHSTLSRHQGQRSSSPPLFTPPLLCRWRPSRVAIQGPVRPRAPRPPVPTPTLAASVPWHLWSCSEQLIVQPRRDTLRGRAFTDGHQLILHSQHRPNKRTPVVTWPDPQQSRPDPGGSAQGALSSALSLTSRQLTSQLQLGQRSTSPHHSEKLTHSADKATFSVLKQHHSEIKGPASRGRRSAPAGWPGKRAAQHFKHVCSLTELFKVNKSRRGHKCTFCGKH